MGQVGQGALADLVTVTKRLAQQDRWRRSAIGDDLNIHGFIIAFIKQKTREARRITWVHKGSKNRANPPLINILSDGGGGKIRRVSAQSSPKAALRHSLIRRIRAGGSCPMTRSI